MATAQQREVTPMSVLDETCRDLLGTIEGAAVCGVFNLDSGHFQAISRATGLSSDQNDIFASAVADIFFSVSVARADEAVRPLSSQQASGISAAQELLISTAHSHQFAMRVGTLRAILLLVTVRETNIGLAWAHLRSALPKLQEQLVIAEAIEPSVTLDPLQAFLDQLQRVAESPGGTLILGQPKQPAGLVLLDDGFVRWATARSMESRLLQALCQNAVRPVPKAELETLAVISRREGRSIGESLLAAGFIDEGGLRRSYLKHIASALLRLSQDTAARPLTWRSGSPVNAQSPFRFSMDELLREAQTLTAIH